MTARMRYNECKFKNQNTKECNMDEINKSPNFSPSDVAAAQQVVNSAQEARLLGTGDQTSKYLNTVKNGDTTVVSSVEGHVHQIAVDTPRTAYFGAGIAVDEKGNVPDASHIDTEVAYAKHGDTAPSRQFTGNRARQAAGF